MAAKPTYEELEERIRQLEKEKIMRIKGEAALRESQSSFSQLFESAPVAMGYATEADGYKGTTWNAAWYRIFGYERDRTEGKSGSDIGLWVTLRDRGRLVEMANRQNFVANFEARLRCRDGSIRHCSLFGRFIERPDNRLLMVIYLDITEQKKAENELINLQHYLSNIIDSMPSVLVGVDDRGRISQWNKTAEQSTGIAADRAMGETLSKVFPRMAVHMEMIHESIRTHEVRQKMRIPCNCQGMTSYEDITIYPLIGQGMGGAVVRLDDVTQKVNMEKMMLQSEKMLSLGGLAAGMAHEINNPLAGMIQTANLMANRLDHRLEIPANVAAAENCGTTLEAIHSYMESRGILDMISTIRESGKRAAEIVENMLNFARKGDASSSGHDPAELLNKTLELAATDYDLKRHYDFKAIDIQKEYEENLPLVPCDGIKIQQVLLNLLRNGAQAMQEKLDGSQGYQPRFDLRLRRESDMLRIEIEDNGPGMSEEVCKRIFEPFFTTKPVGIGTGLGLSISYFIITENHGGQMGVESTLGAGTKFIIRLPLG